MNLLLRTPYGYGWTYKWPRDNHDRIVQKITRGLYHHHFGEILAPTTPIEVTFIDSLSLSQKIDSLNWLRQTINRLCQCNIGGVDRFAYAFGRTPEEPRLSLWVYQFYTRHWAAAITGYITGSTTRAKSRTAVAGVLGDYQRR
jgi:hypothetical protein